MKDLTDRQLAQFRDKLTQLQAELRQALEQGRDAAAIVQLDQQAVGRVSRIDAIQQQQMAQASRRNHRLRLQQITAALLRLETGGYGECGRCEEPIDRERLAARPETWLCLECQTKRESG